MRNMIREEVSRMAWPSHIADRDGDRERELQRAYRRTAFWRLVCVFTVGLLFCLVALVFAGVL